MSNLIKGATVRVRLGGRGRPPFGTIKHVYARGRGVKVQLTTTGRIVAVDLDAITVL